MGALSFRKKVNLLVATPCYGGLVTMRYMQCMCKLMLESPKNNISVQLDMLGYESLITRGRNTLVAQFLDQPGTTHLLFIDSDIAFEVKQVMRMIAFDKDVVAGMYPLKQIEWNAAALERAKKGEYFEQAALRFVGTPCEGALAERQQGFVTAEYAGTGFMLIKRHTLEQMISHYPQTRYTDTHTTNVPSTSPNRYALFDCMIDEQSGVYLSEDYTFCKRWRALGGKIWLDTESSLTHIGAYDYSGTPKPRFQVNSPG